MYGLGAEMMGPPVDPNQPVTAPDVQQQIADIWDYVWNTEPGAAPAPAGPNVAPSWIPGIPNVVTGLGAVAVGAMFIGMLKR